MSVYQRSLFVEGIVEVEDQASYEVAEEIIEMIDSESYESLLKIKSLLKEFMSVESGETDGEKSISSIIKNIKEELK